ASGAPSGGGGSGGGSCSASQKLCGSKCVSPGTSNGCAPSGCTPCPVPVHAYAWCSGAFCDFSCTTGYVKSGSGCVSSGGGGTGGTGGSGGTSGSGGLGGFGGSTNCPPSQPTQGSTCTTGPMFCPYGAVTCICMGQWLCQ
ncbi:MAG: hypothetical protein HYZ29_11760, partial [Myxococcales bacterium]|nr:hypothetical protein [Myxococcales bacterium]